eukprot:TRINITY_DN2034_c0_g1_i1.p1 TRINITY_DN2034_c0_g1~~TRINITY_DN2034_c0_g1_i1.p1  ORF type:complete len:128 (-),score=62.21 TRINITY_DN2034_c0_g1_i1:777-1160(-)
MGLDDRLLRGVYATGFEKPSPVQSRTIVPLSQGRDIVAQAQSGSGKTGSFAIGTLARLQLDRNRRGGPQILVLEPTRELARQTADVYTDLTGYMGIGVVCVTHTTRRLEPTTTQDLSSGCRHAGSHH